MTRTEYRRSRTLAIIVLIIFCIGSSVEGIPIETSGTYLESVDKRIRTVSITEAVKESHGDLKRFEITAYDLSVESCGKLPASRGYGITRSGKSLKGKTWKVRAIAVDPKVIKMGSKVRITLTGWRAKYSGIYTAVDSGGAIKGNRIDLFLGENSYKECIKFGLAKGVKVEILN